MAKELPYFKFFVSEWILGRIYDYPDKVQGAFLVAICHYWNKNCNYNSVDFERKIGKKRFNLLTELKFIEVENETVYISFLDEQYSELSGIQQARIKGGLARAKQMQEQKPSYIDKNKIIEDKDKIKINKFDFKKSLNLFCSNENLVNEWLLVRKNKKATNTETAFNLLKNEIEKSGKTFEEVLTVCVEKSWSGFKSEWITKIENNPSEQKTKFEKITENRNTAHDLISKHYASNTETQ